MTADDARTFPQVAARHADLSALLDRLEAAEVWATLGNGISVQHTPESAAAEADWQTAVGITSAARNVHTLDDHTAYAARIAEAITAARAEEAARWQAKIETLLQLPGNQRVVHAAALRALLDGGKR